jgi:hypothetical protein
MFRSHCETTTTYKEHVHPARWLSMLALGLNLAVVPAHAQQWPEVRKSALGLQAPGYSYSDAQQRRAQVAPAETTPAERVWVIDKDHEEPRASFYSGRVSHPVYNLPLDYLDHPGMSLQDKVYLAQTLVPIDYTSADVTRMVRSGAIACTPLTCVRDGKVIGYSYPEYQRLKAALDASPPAPVTPSGAVKVVGMLRDRFPIYGFDKVDIDLRGPAYAGSKVFLDPFEIIAALPALDADTRKAVSCRILCWGGEAILGYDPVAFARFKRLHEAKSQTERDQFLEQIRQNHAAGMQARDSARHASNQAAKQAKSRQAFEAAYKAPQMSNPGTASAVPIGVIRNAITGNQSAFHLTTWKESNTYVLNREGEAVHYVEYEAQWDLKRENIGYLNSSGGISFPSARRQTAGTVGVVKRGNSWYVVSK